MRGRLVEFAVLFGSVVSLQGARFLFTLLVAAEVGPAEFLVWTQFATLVSYAPVMILGAGNGMNRVVPILVGSGEEAEADRVEASTWFVAGIAVAICLGLAVVLAWPAESALAALIVVSCGAVTVYQLEQFGMRSHLAFLRSGAHQWGWALSVIVGCVAYLASDRSLPTGLMIWTATALAAVALGFLLRSPKLGPTSPSRMASVVKMGFPLMLAGLLGTLFYTADRWIASLTLEPDVAGVYGLASLMAAVVFLVPMVVAQQQYPRLAQAYGAGASADTLRGAARRQSLVAAGASLFASIGVAVAAVGIVPVVLPAYAAVAGPAVILSVGMVALGGSTGFGNLLIVIGARWTYLAILCASFAALVVLMLVGSLVGGVIGLAVGVGIGQLVMMIGVIAAGHRLAGTRVRPT